MTAVAPELEDADITVVLSVRLREYIVFKSSRVGFTFTIVERRFTDVSVRGEGERETNGWEESFVQESCVDEGAEAFLCGELLGLL